MPLMPDRSSAHPLCSRWRTESVVMGAPMNPVTAADMNLARNRTVNPAKTVALTTAERTRNS